VSPRRPDGGPSGLVVVDKPGGLTSHDVVARVRRLVGTRKVGHAGTLDPMATGVLVLGVNKGTRLLGHLALADKTYLATVRLGVATTTDDAEGEVTARHDAGGVDEAAVVAATVSLTGAIEQVPSTVSAIKVDGKRAYALAREGVAVELKARPVTVHRFDVLASRHGVEEGVGVLDVDVEVHCTTGTYVRALARDLGAALGVGGHLTRLRRTTVGPVDVAEAADLALALETGELPVVPLEQAVATFFDCLTLDADQARDVSYGRALAVELPGPGPVAVLAPDGTFLALYRQEDPTPDGEPRAVAVAVFT
jgi:tRNA pseudouridine55 synthase